MIILLAIALGVIIGAKFFPIKLKKLNEKVQVILIALLIFAMGISLGNRENIAKELFTLGFDSLVLAILPMIFSALLVYFITKSWKK